MCSVRFLPPPRYNTAPSQVCRVCIYYRPVEKLGRRASRPQARPCWMDGWMDGWPGVECPLSNTLPDQKRTMAPVWAVVDALAHVLGGMRKITHGVASDYEVRTTRSTVIMLRKSPWRRVGAVLTHAFRERPVIFTQTETNEASADKVSPGQEPCVLSRDSRKLWRAIFTLRE